MRKASGTVTSKSMLVALLYTIIRDEVPPGKVENIMQDLTAHKLNFKSGEYVFSNGWLAAYCKDIVNRLDLPS